MNNEIKEILDFIKDYLDRFSDSQLDLRFEYNDSKLLLDYITNLQQENETLHENNQNMQEEMARVWEENERLNLELSGYREAILRNDDLLGLQDYKSRCEKAIEYIENPRHEMSVLTYQNLLNILQNGSDSQ